MNIRAKMLLPMIALVVVAIAAVLTVVIFIFSGYITDSISASIDTDAGIAEAMLSEMKNEAALASRVVAQNPALVEGILSGDREAILEAATAAQKDAGVEFVTICDTQGTVLVRSHEPDNFGDSVLSQANISHALAGENYTTFEKGTAVKLSLRSGAPIYDAQGNIIGAASSGYRLDQEQFVDRLKALTGVEFTVFLGDERVSTTVVGADGKRAVGTKAAENVSKQVLGGTAYSGHAQVVGKDAIVIYKPIRAADGNVIGMLFAGEYTSEVNEVTTNFLLQGLLVAAILLAIAIPVLLITAGRIVRPIRRMVAAAERLAVGDLDVDVTVDTKDETRMLAEAFNKMAAQSREQARVISTIADGDLRAEVVERSDKDIVGHALSSMLDLNNDVFAKIMISAQQVAGGAGQVAEGSQNLAQSNTEQAAAVDQLRQSILRINENTRLSAEMAGEAATLSDSIRQKAETGSEQMGRMIDAVEEINEASQSINKVIKVIEDIAFQTNILALNAAVEAAHAGTQGKGFAVVAEEVRSLAQKSAVAAKDTANLIANSMEKAGLGTRIASQTAESLNEIVQGVAKNASIASEISGYTTQQAEAIRDISASMDQMATVVTMTSSLSQETAATSQQMSSQAQALTDMVNRFKLRDDGTLESRETKYLNG